MPQSLTEQLIVADAGFWPAVADAVLRAHPREDGAPLADLRGLDVIVPAWTHAPLLRAALHARLASAGHVRCIPPRIYTIAAWAGDTAENTIERRIDLFAALRANAWIRSAFGDQPSALWSLAAHVDAICDELTLAAVDGPEAFEARLQASLARHFHRRAARAVEPQAKLLLQLWRAGLAHDGGAQGRLAALAARSQWATRPLIVIAARTLPAWMRAWLESLAARVPVQVLRADVTAAVAARPLLAAAWPELIDPQHEAFPIAERARKIKPADVASAPTLVEAGSLEEEAVAVCEQVLEWLQPQGQGDLFAPRAAGSIALVAIDRVAARRVRALLERAKVLVRDETGWKLSTTSAAGVVMRLFDLAANGFHHRDLLDWLKSPFTLADAASKTYLVETVEKAIRRQAIVQGLGAVMLALQERQTSAEGEDDRAGALHWLRTLEQHAGRLAGGATTLGQMAQSLEDALLALGMRRALATDAVGIEVLRVLDELRHRILASRETSGVRATPAEFRALIAARFEELAVGAGAIDSPVAMVSLSAAPLRDFDAAVLIGVDAAQLPALPAESLFFSNAVRADLGLPGRSEAVHEQATDLAALLVRVPRVTAVWCARRDNEPRPVASWFARLRAVARAAGHEPQRVAALPLHRVVPAPTERPAPRAPHRVRPTLSATQYQSLVECPYHFYARHLLRLRDLDEVNEEPSPSDYGKAVHDVLARFHTEWRDADLRKVPRNDLARSLSAHADAVFDPQIERRPRLLAWRRQFAETQEAYLDWLDRRALEGWSFVEAEVERKARLPIDADGVASIELVGRIDRIDERGGEIHVLDYKTKRRQKLTEELAIAGENVQLPFYGLLFDKPINRASFVFLQRTSDRQDQVGDLPARQPYPLLVEALRVRLREDMRRVASGAPLPALGNEAVCAWCEMRGLCRRDYWRDAGEER